MFTIVFYVFIMFIDVFMIVGFYDENEIEHTYIYEPFIQKTH